jgi:hypothetical protein
VFRGCVGLRYRRLQRADRANARPDPNADTDGYTDTDTDPDASPRAAIHHRDERR